MRKRQKPNFAKGEFNIVMLGYCLTLAMFLCRHSHCHHPLGCHCYFGFLWWRLRYQETFTSPASVTINHPLTLAPSRLHFHSAQLSIDQAIFWTAIWPTYHISWVLPTFSAVFMPRRVYQSSSITIQHPPDSSFLCYFTYPAPIPIHLHSASTRILLLLDALLLYLPMLFLSQFTKIYLTNIFN